MRLDDLKRAVGVHPQDFSAAAGEVADHFPERVFGDFNFEVVDRFEQAGAGVGECFLERFLAGDLKRNIVGIHRVHFAVVEINLQIHHAVAGQDAFRTGRHDAFLDGRHINTVHILTGESLSELDAGIARSGFDTHPDLGELAGAAGLFFVAILRFCPGFDGLAKRYPWRDKLDLDPVTAFQPVGQHSQVQIALGRHHGLMQFAVHVIEEGRVFFVQRGQAGRDFVLLAFRVQLERGVNVGFRIDHLGQRDDHARAAERVAGVRVLEFNDCADVAGVEAVDRRAVFTVEDVDLANLFGDAAVAVVKLRPNFCRAGVKPEKREFAKLRLAHGLEDIENRLRT